MADHKASSQHPHWLGLSYYKSCPLGSGQLGYNCEGPNSTLIILGTAQHDKLGFDGSGNT